jgi:photosystem II stability/assembly factor-like uncharacterized protein
VFALLAALLTVPIHAQTCPFDNGGSSLEVDGLILTRYALGLTGAPLVASTGINAVDAPTVEASINCPSCGLNITGNPTMTVADATIISRKLAGFSGAALTDNLALGSGTRNTPAAVQSFLLAGCGATGGTVTSITAGTGLIGGTITASGAITADTTYLQRRVTPGCAVGSFIMAIAPDGTPSCATPPPGGTVTSVTAGTGLSGGTIVGAGTIAVANLGIGTAQLADASVTASKLASNGCSNGQILKYLAGAWSCAADDTGGLTGGFTPWQVSATTQLAVANTAYIVTGATRTTITLPASPTVGDGVKVSSPGAGGFTIAPNAGQSIVAGTIVPNVWVAHENARQWTSIASSADGSKLAATVSTGQIYTSSDSGLNWTPRDSARSWMSITSSADGSKLAATVAAGLIYTSTDSGVSWAPRNSARNWRSITSSADGNKLAAVDFLNGQIYTSADSGVNWTARETSRNWFSITSSSDGNKLAAVVVGGQIYTSTDSGVTWTARESSRQWNSITSSGDGSKLAAVGNGGQIYTSTNSGVSWTPRDSSRAWISITSSADGNRLAAVVVGGQIYTSTDSGVTWTPRDTSRNWNSITSSADGSKLAAVDNTGLIYTTTTTGVTTISGAALTTAELVYAGGGVWSVALQQGTLVTP